MGKRSTVFMDAKLEKQICDLAVARGFSVTPALGKSPTRKEIELRKGFLTGTSSIYISRSVGITKGELQLVISPDLYQRVGAKLSRVSSIRPAQNRLVNCQTFSSSNYRYFANKGSNGHREHWGYGYRLPANDGLRALGDLLSAV